MKIKHIYLILCIIGFVFPYYFLIQFLIEHGINLQLMIDKLFANKISSFFGVDVFISAVVLVLFVLVERKNVKKYSLAIFGTLLVGVSFGLPLFLYLREYNLEKKKLN